MSDKFVTTDQVLPNGIRIHQSTLPTKGDDRTVILPFKHGTMIAIFDGHYSSQLAEFAAQHLPQRVADHFDPTALDLDQTIVKIFEDFDQSLILPVTGLFRSGEDWSDTHWEDRSNVHAVVGYSNEDAQFREGRRAVVGTTVLIGIIDTAKKGIWVVSLGDSDAVCGRMQQGEMVPVVMSDRHNCTNEKELKRLLEEHPGEKELVQNNRVLGLLAVTRALGDHQLKVRSRFLADRILSYFYPSPIPPVAFEDWDHRGHLTPPYLSSSPSIQRYDLQPGDMLVFASDGLRDSMDPRVPPADRWDVIMSLANGKDDERLGHERIRPECAVNTAELLIKNVLFGTDVVKMNKELADLTRDDISVVIVDLGSLP
ncbi:phosphatase 2C-like domain-containing protein [Mycena galericulata]|nr:phosphatase 2C-like domain-containing protein [Mycena galericulata]